MTPREAAEAMRTEVLRRLEISFLGMDRAKTQSILAHIRALPLPESTPDSYTAKLEEIIGPCGCEPGMCEQYPETEVCYYGRLCRNRRRLVVGRPETAATDDPTPAEQEKNSPPANSK